MNYLLDTNICIVIINGSSAAARHRFDSAIASGSRLFVSSVLMFELWYGVFKSSRVRFNTERVHAFLEGPVAVLPFEEDDAKIAASVRADLKVKGTPIGSYDILLAGQAMQRKLTLVTANVSEFSRIKGLLWQDWAKA